MKIAMVGLGKMGGNMTRRLCRGGIDVVGYDRSQKVVHELAESEGMIPAASISELVELLSPPRVVWLMVPSGEPTEQQIQELIPLLAEKDIVIDGGNSNYHDSQRRGALLEQHDVDFVVCNAENVAGGTVAIRESY